MKKQIFSAEDRSFFEKVPSFLQTIQYILEQGFFSSFKVEIDSYSPTHLHLEIRAKGFVPWKKRDLKKGIQALANVEAMIEECKRMLRNSKARINSRDCKVEIKDWHRMDRSSEKITGIKGEEYDLELRIFMYNR